MPPPPSFLTLPPDLRQRIYTNLLVSPTPIKGPSARQHQNETYDIHTAILRVNRQTHTEARHVFLSLNTFRITSLPPPASVPTQSVHPIKRLQQEDEEGSGALEPPLQLKDLALVRKLDIDLVYWGNRGAERYITGLSFLLREVKESLSSLKIMGDVRPHTTSHTPDETACITADEDFEQRSFDARRFITGFHAASQSWRFQDALAGLALQHVELRFDFAESHFDFLVDKDALAKNDLAQIVGQVLVARTEIGIREALEELEGKEVEGHVMDGM